jgi:hypothetical protein
MKVAYPVKPEMYLLTFKNYVMNFQTMSKQRKFVLISAVVGFISMFLPWISISMFGFRQNVNGMHDKGIIVFLCFVVAGIIAYIGNQTVNLDKTKWTVTLIAGALALLFIIWFYSQANNTIMGPSLVGYGLYLAAIASIGILISAYAFRSPSDNLKDGFDSLKSSFSNKVSKPENVSNTTTTTTPPDLSDDDYFEKSNQNSSQ